MKRLDLQKEREATRRALHNAQRAVVFNALVIIGLAVLAIWIARMAQRNAETARTKALEAFQAENRAQQELGKAHLSQARAERLSRAPGRRQRALDALKAAAQIRHDAAQRDEAVASLASYDLAGTLLWQRAPVLYAVPSFSGDFSVYVVGGSRNEITRVRTKDREVLTRISVDDGDYGGLGLSPDGQWICAYFTSHKWRFWEAKTGRLVREISVPMFRDYALTPSFSQDSRWFVMCLKTNAVLMVNLEDDSQRVIETDAMPTVAVLDPAGQRLGMAMGTRLAIRGFGPTTNTVRQEFSAAVQSLAWHPDGERLAVALANGDVMLLDLRTGVVLRLQGHSVNATFVQFHPLGEILVSASWDGTTRFWDASTGRMLFLTREGIALGFDRQGSQLAFLREGSGFGIWQVDVPLGFAKVTFPLKHSGKMVAVNFHPKGRHLAAGDLEEWYLADLETRRVTHRQKFHRLRSVQFSPTGEELACSGGDGLKVYHCAWSPAAVSLSPAAIGSGLAEEQGWERASFSLDGKHLVVVGPDKGYVIQTETLQPEFRFGQDHQLLAFTAISPDNRWVAASAWKSLGVCLWDRATPTNHLRLIPESSFVDFDPAGRRLVTSNHRGYQLWNAPDWKLHRRHDEDTGSYAPGPARFSPGGDRLAVAPQRNVILLVEPESGEVTLRLQSPEEVNLSWLDFSQDGRKLAAATEQNEVHIWDLDRIQNALTELGLATKPSPGRPATPTSPILAASARFDSSSSTMVISLILGGMVLAVLLGVRSIFHQRQQMRNYLRIEELAEDQNQNLLAAELELQQGQKMKALGTLAAGVAHDFNNLLSVISLANGFLKRGVAWQPDLAEESEAIDRAVNQGRQVVQSMLGYSRTEAAGAPEVVNLCEVVEDSVGLLGQQFLSGIRLTMELDRRVPAISASRSRLEQILLNLIVNASEAMDGHGRLAIQVHERSSSELEASVLRPTEAARYVELRVQDDGPGIAPEVRERIFDPFFTTKNRSARQGTGLGLSTIYTLAGQEGYGIDVESVPGRGACFRIWLPVKDAACHSPTPQTGTPG